MSTEDDLGYRLAVVRNTRDMTQQFVADTLGMAGQQAVSEIEQRKHLTDQEIEPFATLYKVSVEYIKTFKIDAMSKTVINMHDNQQAYGAHIQNNNINPYEEYLKVQAENKKLYERLLEAEKKIAAMQQEVIDTLKKLLDQFGNGD